MPRYAAHRNMKGVTNWRITGALVLAIALVWAAVARPAHASIYPLASPDQRVVGEDHTVITVNADTLYDLARKYDVDSQELIRANPGIDPWLPGAGKTVIIPGRLILPPGPHVGIIVNVPEHRLYYFPKARRGKPQVVVTYPVSIGKMDWRTPIGLTHVIARIKHPVWYVPAGVRQEHIKDGDPLPRVVPAGPDNPLGQFALRLAAGGGTYLIHGTNNPIAVGMPVTHGCVRLFPDDVAQLFPMVAVGTPVHIINDPIKVAWVDGQLLLEAHPPIDEQGRSLEPNVGAFSQLLQQAVGDETVAINWDYARDVLKKANGVLATVGLQADLSAPNDPAAGPSPAVADSSAPAAHAITTIATAAGAGAAAAIK